MNDADERYKEAAQQIREAWERLVTGVMTDQIALQALLKAFDIGYEVGCAEREKRQADD